MNSTHYFTMYTENAINKAINDVFTKHRFYDIYLTRESLINSMLKIDNIDDIDFDKYFIKHDFMNNDITIESKKQFIVDDHKYLIH